MDKEFAYYITENGKFNKDLYYKEIVEGANKIFNELFGKYSCSQVNNIIQSYTIKQSNRSIFSKFSFGWVYFIEDKSRRLIKIGMTNNIPSRLSQLKTSYKFCGLKNDLKVVALCATSYRLRTVEKYFHDMFEKYHSYMEWFEINGSVLIDILQKYVLEKKYENKNVDGTFIFLMNDKSSDMFNAKFTNEMPRKRLDPFYKDQIVSVAESHSLNDGHNRLYDILIDELKEMKMKGLKIDLEQVIDRIEKKYLDLDKVFFEQVEKEKDILLKMCEAYGQSPTDMFNQTEMQRI